VVDLNLRELLGEEYWQLLEKGERSLDDFTYICCCETCGKVFYEDSLENVKNRMLSGDWDPQVPDVWFLEAAEHWLSLKFHSVRVYVQDRIGLDKKVVMDLSKRWSELKLLKGLSDKDLKKEIEKLRQLIKLRKKGNE